MKSEREEAIKKIAEGITESIGEVCPELKGKFKLEFVPTSESMIEEETLSDKIIVFTDRYPAIGKCVRTKDIKEDIKTGKNNWLNKGSVDLDEECIVALIEIINKRVGKRLIK